MTRKSLLLLGYTLVLGLVLSACSGGKTTTTLRLIHTTDVHGNLFPEDHINQRAGTGSMARLAEMMRQVREQEPNVLILDGGDFLQGEPITYFSNYIDTLSPNAVSSAMNYLKYDAAVIGNHDIEPGHSVYDKFVREAKFPVLGANALVEGSDKSYFEPYKVFDLSGVRVAVLGLVTPAIPQWLPKHLYEGMEFQDIIESAQIWVPRILEKEQPDLMVALIHSGLTNDNESYMENAGEALSTAVAGIDIILMGHDHRQTNKWIKRSERDSVLLINPANHLDFVSDLSITITKDGDKTAKHITATLHDLNQYQPDADFLKTFAREAEGVQGFLDKRIGLIDAPVVAADALFGPSTYMNVVHQMQMYTVGAELSFAAPLSLSAELAAGDVYVRDLFKFCPFSNHLYVMELTGAEIKGYLEHSYAGWTEQMTSREGHLIKFRPDAQPTDRYKTLVPTFNYSSAHGIDYTVDVTKPAGERINIQQMSSGEPFSLDRRYRVAINSYRAGGAGGMLTLGSGINKADLSGRIVGSSELDQFFSLMKFFEVKGVVRPVKAGNWSFLPEAWVQEAAERDRAFLFAK